MFFFSMLVWYIFTRFGFHLDVVVALRKRWCCTSPNVESSSSSFLTSPSAVLTPDLNLNLENLTIWIWECPRKYSHSPAKALFKTLLLKVPPAESLGWPGFEGFEDGNQYKTMKICWKVSNSPLWWAAVGHQITWVPWTCFQYPYCATACGKTMVYNPNLKLFCEMKSIFFEWEN